MKTKIILSTMVILLSAMTYVFAADMEGAVGMEQIKPIDVGNMTCPVTGEKIGGMGPGVTYELEGKIYHFCCAGCIEEFKKDPVKYIKIIEEQKKHDEQLGEEGKEVSKNLTGQQ